MGKGSGAAETQPRAYFLSNLYFCSVSSLSSASGPGGPLPGVVPGLQSEGLAGRHRHIVPTTSCLDHAHSAALRGEPDGRQREHGSPLQRVTFQLPGGPTAAGYW